MQAGHTATPTGYRVAIAPVQIPIRWGTGGMIFLYYCVHTHSAAGDMGSAPLPQENTPYRFCTFDCAFSFVTELRENKEVHSQRATRLPPTTEICGFLLAGTAVCTDPSMGIVILCARRSTERQAATLSREWWQL